MILKPNEVCKFYKNCKYNKNISSVNFCRGTDKLRNTTFECSYVDGEGKSIKEGHARSIYDVTGKMEFIQE